MEKECRYDEIGYWSEIKLDIIRKYATAYSTIISGQREHRFRHCYVDAFAGPGIHRSKITKVQIFGSPSIALEVSPPFTEYYFIELNRAKIDSLEKISKYRDNVFIYHGDCNEILIDKVLPNIKYEDYKRGLCILDPYGLDLDWEVILRIGKMKSVEIFLNFPVSDMNRNVLWRNPEKVSQTQIERMNRFWGDGSWREIAYVEPKQIGLFESSDLEKVGNSEIAEAFRKRLCDVAGFKIVPKPIAMRNSKNAVVYYLFFASHKPVAVNIVRDIFKTYEGRRG